MLLYNISILTHAYLRTFIDIFFVIHILCDKLFQLFQINFIKFLIGPPQ
jgi:hypothetical protein